MGLKGKRWLVGPPPYGLSRMRDGSGKPATVGAPVGQRGFPSPVRTSRTICNWVRQADLDEDRREDDLTATERHELRRPRRENRWLREDRKEAAA